MTLETLLATLGIPSGTFAPGSVLQWVSQTESPDGPKCSDALLTWDEDGTQISASVVDRSGGEGVVAVGFEAYAEGEGSFRIQSEAADEMEAVSLFAEAVKMMVPVGAA